MPKANEWLNEPCLDWDDDKGFHGFARTEIKTDPDNPRRYYSVRLSVRGKQHEISRHKNQDEAARAYDLALLRLIAYVPACSKPNFPDVFDSQNLSDVDALCPFANELHQKVRAEMQQANLDPDKTEETFKAQRLVNLKQAKTNENTKHDHYANLKARMTRACIDAHAHYVKLNEYIERVRMVKFPQLNHAVIKAECDLATAVTSLAQARTQLMEHTEVFENYKKNGLL